MVDNAARLLTARIIEMKSFGTDPASWDTTVDALEREMRHQLDDGGVLRFGNERVNGVVVNPVEETPMLGRFRLEAQKRLTATEVKSVEDGDGLSQLRDILFHLTEDGALPSVDQLETLVGVAPSAQLQLCHVGARWRARDRGDRFRGGWHGLESAQCGIWRTARRTAMPITVGGRRSSARSAESASASARR